MVRTPDPFWAYVVDQETSDGSKKCMFCEHTYASGTSVSRVKYHLSRRRGAGVKICETVPKAIQEAASAAINCPPEKKLKTIASSSNSETDGNTISTSLPEQINEVEIGMPDCSPGSALELLQTHIGEIELHDECTPPGDLLVDVAEGTMRTSHLGQECELTYDISCLFTKDNVICNSIEKATTGLLQHVERGGLLERFTVGTDGQPAYAKEMDSQSPITLQAMDLDCQVVERLCHQIYSSSVVDNVLTNEGNMTREPEQTFLQHVAGETEGDAFPTPKLVGGGFGRNEKVIWSWLMNDYVSFIGIYGMGGVGKTILVKHIHNQLLDRPDAYPHVYWVTVSQDFSISKLQNHIAQCIGLYLSNEDDVMHKAAKLSKALAKKGKYVLILDDLWSHFDLEEVGIPNEMNGCKLILTTRLLDVCRQLGCKGNVIKVEPLLEEEAWNLFTMELGKYDIKLEPLAKSVASECDGLPLGLRTMARSMRGVHDVCEWRNALEELKESRVRQRHMEPEVFRILRFSYLHLYDSALQQCFLYCALFPEDFEIHKEELIELLIAEKIIEGRKSRQAEFDKGHEMLNRLENACLLESVTALGGFSAVKMHDLVRDMARQEMRENSGVMVEAGEQLQELPDDEMWTQDLVRVSLMKNYFKEISSFHSPRCPNLSTLLLCRNEKLKFIGDSFFKQFCRLEVLDLSCTAIQELPDSISDLVTLNVLLLGMCSDLTHVPSLAKLKALKKLDLHETGLREVPSGLELLSCLKYLNLNATLIMEFPAGILPKLRHLQVLRLHLRHLQAFMTVQAEDLALLRKLETLECHFSNHLVFNKYVKSLEACLERQLLLRKYKFTIGQVNFSTEKLTILDFSNEHLSRSVYLYGQEFESCGNTLVLPKGIQELVFGNCSDMRRLVDFYPLEHATELKSLSISGCALIECLVSLSQMSLSVLGTVEAVHLHDLDKLSSLSSQEGAGPTGFSFNGIFSHLKMLEITYCRMLKVLFPPGLLPNLRNLEIIEVRECLRLEKIIATEERNVGSSNDLPIEFCLPKLQILDLRNLPALRSICCGKLICNSLQQIIISYCESVETLPFSCSPQTLKFIYAFPEEWWESVMWNEKSHGYNVWHSWLQGLEGSNYIPIY